MTLVMNPYLNFDGQTKAAFEFYGKAFGAKPEMMEYGQIPMGDDPLPKEAVGKIMHASIPVGGGQFLMGSDVIEAFGWKVKPGNNVHVSLHPSTRKEADRLFAALSPGGKVIQPMADAPWGDYWGNFEDPFGIQWMINCASKA